MHLPSIIIPLLSLSVTSVSANVWNDRIGPQVGNDGSIIFCEKPNMQGRCTQPTIFDSKACFYITDSDTMGAPGSSWNVTAGIMCRLYTDKKCHEGNTDLVKWMNNVPGRKTYRTFRCLAGIEESAITGREGSTQASTGD